MSNCLSLFMFNVYKKQFLYTFAVIVLTTLLLYLTKILQPFELFLYDFNFLLRPLEPTDKQIVIIQWDEKSIESQKETVISDKTLLNLLIKVQEQRPTIVGINIYRNLPTNSPQLPNAQNIQIHNALDKLYKTTDNLIFIEKLVEPVIHAPKIIALKNQTAASDIPVSKYDLITRQAYIYPHLDRQTNSSDMLYLGAKLGLDYLAAQGFSVEKLNDNKNNILIKISDDKNNVFLKPLNLSLFKYQKKQNNFALLVNWRKGKPTFNKISATDVIEDNVRGDFFYNKIVLIGSVFTLTGEKYYTPIDGLQKSATYEVEVAAQVASSLVNAATENRTLITPVSKIFMSLTVLLSLIIIIKIFDNYKDQDFNSIDLYFITFSYCLCLSIILIICNIILLFLGFWLPISIAVGNIWSLWFFLNFYLYKQKERKRSILFVSFIKNIQHNFGQPLESINLSTKRIDDELREIKNSLENSPDRQFLINSIPNLEVIQRKNSNIKDQKLKIERYRQRTIEFIHFGYANYISLLVEVEVNLFISQLVAKFIDQYECECHVEVEEIYDRQLRMGRIDVTAIEIVIENLLSNAFYAVSHGRDDYPDYIPTVKVISKLKRKRIEFTIEDNGRGIAKKNQAKIFEPFISFGSGIGVGLNIVTEILSLYQGNIKVESEVDKGARFIFSIPLNKK